MILSATDASALRSLWALVVVQGIKDAMGVGIAADSIREPEIQPDAQAWLGTPDYRHCCALAGLDPDAVLDRLQSGHIDMAHRVLNRPGENRRRAA